MASQLVGSAVNGTFRQPTPSKLIVNNIYESSYDVQHYVRQSFITLLWEEI